MPTLSFGAPSTGAKAEPAKPKGLEQIQSSDGLDPRAVALPGMCPHAAAGLTAAAAVGRTGKRTQGYTVG